MRRVAWIGSWLVLAGCMAKSPPKTPPCDEEALNHAAAELEVISKDPRPEARAIDALAEACPALDSRLVWIAKLYYSDALSDDRQGELGSDRRLNYMHRTLCADLDALERNERTRHQAETIYEVCDLERFDLLEPGEVFIRNDLTGFLLYGWLIGHEVDPKLARRFVRGLMHSTATSSAARRRCWYDAGAYGCVVAARRDGIEVPVSTSPWKFEARDRDEVARVSLSLTELRVDGAHVSDLVDGRFDEAALADAVRDTSACLIAADRALASGTLLRVMQASSCSYELVVEGDGEAGSIPLKSPDSWRGGAELRPDAVRAVVDSSRIRITVPHEDPVSFPFEPREAFMYLEVTANRIAAERPPSIHVSVADSLPLGQLVAVLDALRGTSCMRDAFDRDYCYLTDPILDFDQNR